MAKAKWLSTHRRKWIVITEETHEELHKLKIKNESFDSVIRRLLKHYKINKPQGY